MLVPSSPYVATAVLPALAYPVMMVPHRFAILTMMPIPAITATSAPMIVAPVMPHLIIAIVAVIVTTHLIVATHLVATVRLIIPVYPAVTLGRISLS
ncbi:MAG: hypothetical protein JWL66_1185 [Sphingomonadales bacterium]|nr:hypothetical protein [Sphingomonadales bacterium]